MQNDDDEMESLLAAQAMFTSIRRLIEACKKDQALLEQIEEMIYPCLLHSLTAEGLDSIEEGIDCIVMLCYHGYKNGKTLSPRMWKLYPQLLYVCAGDESSQQEGYGFEFVNQICLAMKNYVSRDPANMLAVGEDQQQTHLQLSFHFIVKCL